MTQGLIAPALVLAEGVGVRARGQITLGVVANMGLGMRLKARWVKMRNSRRFTVVAGIAVILALGCTTSVEAPVPTPDVPAFADGEATALVYAELLREWDAHRASSFEGRRVSACDLRLYPAIFISDLFEEYEGDGVWFVSTGISQRGMDLLTQAALKDIGFAEGNRFEWRVYRQSLTVAPANTSTRTLHFWC